MRYVIFALFIICVLTRGYIFWKGTTSPVAFIASGGAFGFGIASCVALDGIWR